MKNEPSQSRMDRRQFLKNAGMAAAGLALAPYLRVAEAVAADPPKPNVLFVIADQWRFSAFSHATDPLVQTPNFDRLTEQGACWTRMYAANPVCTPNRSSIITGRFPHQHGMIYNNLMLPPTERCIGQVFEEAGYATHYIGKWHMDGEEKPGFVPPNWRRRGFKTFEGFNRGHYYPTGAQYFTNDGQLLEPDQFESFYQTDLAIAYMKQHKDQPFFCYLSWGPPHTPYRPPAEFDRFTKMKKLAWRPNVPEELRDTPTLHKEMAGYFGLCETLDHEMGRLLKALDELGIAENTCIVFTADHGDMHGSHGLYRKGKPEEEAFHIPLFMRFPSRIKPDQKPETLVSSIDLMPTILALCGLPGQKTCTGRDLSAAVLGGPTPKVNSIYGEGAMTHQLKAGKAKRQKGGEDEEDAAPGGEWRAVVTPEHKLAMNIGGKISHLFDLKKDPYEMNNLANKHEHIALQKNLLEEAKRWALKTGDPFPKPPTPAEKMYNV